MTKTKNDGGCLDGRGRKEDDGVSTESKQACLSEMMQELTDATDGDDKKKQQTENIADETELIAAQESKRRRRLGWREIWGIDQASTQPLLRVRRYPSTGGGGY